MTSIKLIEIYKCDKPEFWKYYVEIGNFILS